MDKLVNRIFRRYGTQVLVQGSVGTYLAYAFAQPRETAAGKWMLPGYTPLGRLPQRHYVICFPPRTMKEGNTLYYDEKWYIVRRLDHIPLRGKELYDRCLCEERGEGDSWGK